MVLVKQEYFNIKFKENIFWYNQAMDTFKWFDRGREVTETGLELRRFRILTSFITWTWARKYFAENDNNLYMTKSSVANDMPYHFDSGTLIHASVIYSHQF